MHHSDPGSYFWRIIVLMSLCALVLIGCEAEKADVKGESSAASESGESGGSGDESQTKSPGSEGEAAEDKQAEDDGEQTGGGSSETAGGAENDADAATAGSEPTASGATAETVRVEMLDPGKEPRKELRYSFSAGNTQKVEISMDMSAAVEMGGRKMPESALPTTTSRLNLTSAEVNEDGSLRYEYTLEEVEVAANGGNPELIKMMEQQMKVLEGLEGWARVDSRGQLLESKLTPPENTSPQLQEQLSQMEQTFQQLAVPLPEEAVGVGARWRAVTETESNGITLRQLADYTLKSLDGTRGVFDVSITQEADPQQVKRPDLPPGTEVQLVKLESKGTGSSSFDLTRLVPESQTDLSMTMHMTMSRGGKSADMKMSSKMRVELKSPGKEAQ